MTENKYFILSLPEPALDAILKHTVQKKMQNVRQLYDGSYVIKLPVGATIPDELAGKKVFSLSEIGIEIEKRETGRPPHPWDL